MFYQTNYETPLGTVTLACDADGENLVGLWNEGQKYHGGSIPGSLVEKDEIPLFDKAKDWLDSYFRGENPPIADLPLAPFGTEFRQEVWNILCEIPYGEVTSYGSIAKKMAERRGKKSMSSQAVGGAVGHNPISIIIPCHRVVGSDGSLTGYAGGLQKKIQLLELEGVDMSGMFIPKKGTAL